MKGLAGKVVLVSGGAKGIGGAVVRLSLLTSPPGLLEPGQQHDVAAELVGGDQAVRLGRFPQR